MSNDTMVLRMNLLGGMDAYLTDNISDEEVYYDDWKAEGVPDEPTEDDLRTIAEDEELWLGAVKSFARCVKYCC